VQRERKVSVFGSAARPALGGLLCLLLILFGIVSANHVLHQKLHGNSSSASHLCLVCSFSKGQASAADPGPILAIFVFALFFFIPLLPPTSLPASDRRLAPSRGPPFSSPSFRVVG